jgi:activator of 2-hydroxyglutaryl-CoA dehydratase
MYAHSNNLEMNHFAGLNKLEEYLNADSTTFGSLPKLIESGAEYNKYVHPIIKGGEKTRVYLGIDVGSLSTNVVLIDEQHRVIARRYLPTAGKPLEAIQKGMTEIYDEIGENVEVISDRGLYRSRYHSE